eukprot:9926448-Heterocapsa_arctica.AAC.1
MKTKSLITQEFAAANASIIQCPCTSVWQRRIPNRVWLCIFKVQVDLFACMQVFQSVKNVAV